MPCPNRTASVGDPTGHGTRSASNARLVHVPGANGSVAAAIRPDAFTSTASPWPKPRSGRRYRRARSGSGPPPPVRVEHTQNDVAVELGHSIARQEGRDVRQEHGDTPGVWPGAARHAPTGEVEDVAVAHQPVDANGGPWTARRTPRGIVFSASVRTGSGPRCVPVTKGASSSPAITSTGAQVAISAADPAWSS